MSGFALHSCLGGVDSQPFGKTQAEAIEESSLSLVGSYDAAHSQVARRRVCGGQDDVGAVDGGEFLKDGSWAVAEPRAALPLLEHLPQHIGQEADEDVGEHAIGALVPNRPDRQLALVYQTTGA